MIRRLIVLGLGSASLAIALVLLRHAAFSDILPLPESDPQQSAWRFDAAYLVTTIAWIAAEVSAISAIALIGLLWSNRPAKP
jgi:hypothetical protein